MTEFEPSQNEVLHRTPRFDDVLISKNTIVAVRPADDLLDDGDANRMWYFLVQDHFGQSKLSKKNAFRADVPIRGRWLNIYSDEPDSYYVMPKVESILFGPKASIVIKSFIPIEPCLST